jgi:hypothetical protein
MENGMNRDMVEQMLGIVRPPYAWRVDVWPATTDDDGWVFRAEPEGRVDEGPHDAPDNLLARVRSGEGRRFRCRNDDEVVYFEGRILIGSEEDMDGELLFAPLWDLGEAYGCTEIQYRERTERGGYTWKTL